MSRIAAALVAALLLTQPSFAYQADIHTRVYIGERSSSDSGTVLFSPPTCYRMTMAVSKV